MESDLYALLKGICPRVYPDVAPEGTAKPYITWQAIGGASWRYLDNTPADKRNKLLQVSVWAESRLAALALVHQVEEALCAAVAFTAKPEGEAISITEDSPRLYGEVQRFSIVATR